MSFDHAESARIMAIAMFALAILVAMFGPKILFLLVAFDLI